MILAVNNLESRHHASVVRFVTRGLKDITEKQRDLLRGVF